MTTPQQLPTYTIKKQETFNEQFRAIITHPEIAEDILSGVFSVLRHTPEKGQKTRKFTPLPVYAWFVYKTDRHPGLMLTYCYQYPVVVLLGARATIEEDDEF